MGPSEVESVFKTEQNEVFHNINNGGVEEITRCTLSQLSQGISIFVNF